jgi:hypothetical protein
MRRGWKGLALVAVWLWLVAVGQAQPGLPVGAGQMPEPTPTDAPPAKPVPYLVPGPISPQAAPHGPGEELSLPAGHNSAFESDPTTEGSHFFVHLGAVGYQRSALAGGPFAVIDPGIPATPQTTRPVPFQILIQQGPNFGKTINVVAPITYKASVQQTGFFDTGNAPPPGSTVYGSYGDVPSPWAYGFSATVGYLVGDFSLELSGFYQPWTSNNVARSSTNILPQVNSQAIAANGGTPVPVVNNVNTGQIILVNSIPIPQDIAFPVFLSNINRLDSFFFNAPAGFGGTNGLWSQADIMQVRFRSALAGAEVNARSTNLAFTGLELLLGARYLDVREELGFFADDNALTQGPDPTNQATYLVQTRSQIVAPQVGLEYQRKLFPGVALGIMGKGAWGANFVQTDISLTRGDGLVGFNTHTNHVQFSQIYELGAYVDIYMLERARLRLGYNSLWVLNVPTALGSLDYDLSHTTGTGSRRGNIFYQGPRIEFQFLF